MLTKIKLDHPNSDKMDMFWMDMTKSDINIHSASTSAQDMTYLNCSLISLSDLMASCLPRLILSLLTLTP